MRLGWKHLWPFNPNNRAVNITTSHNYCLFASFTNETIWLASQKLLNNMSNVCKVEESSCLFPFAFWMKTAMIPLHRPTSRNKIKRTQLHMKTKWWLPSGTSLSMFLVFIWKFTSSASQTKPNHGCPNVKDTRIWDRREMSANFTVLYGTVAEK